GLNAFVPEILMKPVKMFGDCVLPIALIVVGGTLARIETHKVRNTDIFWVVIAKVVVLPACALGVLYFVEIDFLLGYFILLEFCVPTATSLSVLGRMFDVESDFINQGILVTHLVSIFTIPLFLAVYSFVKG
ncbi:MAG TPA: AEC family transporter, partial [Candidatus Omnitrophota bacterium]|nr:AEC family transporter [Candidatus Omnitrophota bacterium]